ncbi:MAG: TusE/DsrC/DsvC family sulfur relay protein [Sulfuricella sp.]|nr:TusE/DsrC/DsvC family sulfur relay protein [Sulfuricella sp.]
MYDINQIVEREGRITEGDLLDFENWSELAARKLAAEEGIDLSKEHWQVINFLRDNYQQCGPWPSGRAVLGLLEENFIQQGGKKYLYHLFPRGPVVQACKIAGLPLPPYSADASFGSVM